MPLSLGMSKDKTSMSVWLTQEEKDIWKQLARLNNMNLSAYTHFVIMNSRTRANGVLTGANA